MMSQVVVFSEWEVGDDFHMNPHTNGRVGRPEEKLFERTRVVITYGPLCIV